MESFPAYQNDLHSRIVDLESHYRNRDIFTRDDVNEESTLLGSSSISLPSSIMNYPLSSSSFMGRRILLATSMMSCALLMISMYGFYSHRASNLIHKATHFMGIKEKEIDSPEDRYLPSSCPGLLLTSGVSDPRDLIINGAEIAGS